MDDPFTFGQIAAVNALSDVYAMGGRPVTAMNIVCFPVKTMELAVLKEILLGGLSKMREAGVVLVGGHSVMDEEIKYGLSVTGVIHPDKVLLNRGCKEGDRLILTKPLGTGIAGTAEKADLAHPDLIARARESMTTLNMTAAEIMIEEDCVHACTDVTGFGLIGHACEMIEGEEVGMTIYSSQVPFFPGTLELIETGLVPGGLERNKQYRLPLIDKESSCPESVFEIMFDPETAGGLLLSVPPERAEGLVGRLRRAGVTEAAVIGEVEGRKRGRIKVV